MSYTTKAIVDQGRRGEDYKFDPVYSIIVTGFDIKELTGRLISEVVLKERHTNEIYTEDMVMIFASLAQLPYEWDECQTELERLLYLIKYMHTMDKNSKAYKSKEYGEFFEAAETGSLASDEYVAYSQSYAKLIDDQHAIDYAEQKALQRGREEGRQEGREETQIENARKMLEMKFPVETISQITGLSVAQITAL